MCLNNKALKMVVVIHLLFINLLTLITLGKATDSNKDQIGMPHPKRKIQKLSEVFISIL